VWESGVGFVVDVVEAFCGMLLWLMDVMVVA